jgi:NAD(P)H-flavin reductase
MVCGPEIMMKYSIEELIGKGTPEENIFLSLERNMKCAVGFCGHCQYGPQFICKDGPVFNYPVIKYLFEKKEI